MLESRAPRSQEHQQYQGRWQFPSKHAQDRHWVKVICKGLRSSRKTFEPEFSRAGKRTWIFITNLAACLSCKLRIAHEHSFHQFTGASRCSCDPTPSGPIWWYVERSTQHLHISKQQKKLGPRIGLASLVHEFAALQFAKCEASQKLFLLMRFVP